ncbi:class I SAM-dependent methyltransferase [Bradyrhizobium sp. C-145]|uniref:Class I SAM-dependent methyltransferase n=1 Tax=Bradyrhizobium zhanjiangense TaxID=1325107 RepID=A0ABY0DU51_9BRAD|nr:MULTISPECIES: methyltransferase domain-containing protein [Bradyrhizobium]RXG99137.1 class I SAM-dependent methyltransferase [Bradyrhizobium zhanjiangense]UQR65431.1 class I SAM-dependent methyltransferase [Bradyrhizobium sp. C-145]
MEKSVAEHYGAQFFKEQSGGSFESASVIVPLVLRLFKVNSVVDVGCGVGAWLHEFATNGVSDYLGIDGDYVPRDQLRIPSERFRSMDLRSITDIGRKFDLACSLEVAEHLPESSANEFVSALVAAAPIVLFSAAVKGQGGRNHLNEQWPSYWAERFSGHGYSAFDCVRPQIYDDSRIRPWYRQNLLVFCRGDRCPEGYSSLTSPFDLDRVLPDYFEYKLQEVTEGKSAAIAARHLLGNLGVLARAARRRSGL